MHQKRLKNLQNTLKNENCEAFLITDLTDLYYLTGINLSVGQLLVTEDSVTLFVDGRYIENCKKNSPFPVKPATEFSIKGFDSIGFCQDTTTYETYQNLKKVQTRLLPIENPVKLLRMIKDETEQKALKEAAVLGSLGFDYLCTLLKNGVKETELAVELEIFWLKHGGKLAFDPIIAFGKNGSMPHYIPQNICLKNGESVLFDIGVKLKHYNSDMTRCVYFGKPENEIEKIYNIVLKAQTEALKICCPGTKIWQLDKVARDYIVSQGYGANFTHNLGHGIGLQVHEYPFLKNQGIFGKIPLKEGMVITIEPGIYLPDIGGIRIEDTVLITKNGHENLTNRQKTDPFIFL